jgi:hypothetical protein
LVLAGGERALAVWTESHLRKIGRVRIVGAFFVQKLAGADTIVGDRPKPGIVIRAAGQEQVFVRAECGAGYRGAVMQL